MTRGAARVGAVTAAVAAALVTAAPAFGHATLLQTSPARGAVVEKQPPAVLFRFSERVELNFSAVHVYDVSGDVVDSGVVEHPAGAKSDVSVGLRPGLARGTYTATFRVISADGHPVSGGFVFSIGEAGRAPTLTVAELAGGVSAGRGTTIAFGAARAVQYGAIALAIGGLAFIMLPWLGGLRAVAGAGSEWRQTSETLVSRAGMAFAAAVVAGVVSSVAGIVLQGQTASGGSLLDAMRWTVVRDVLETHFGLLWGIRLLVWVVLGQALVLVYRRRELPVMRPATLSSAGLVLPRRLGNLWHVTPLLVILAFLAISPALAGHANAQDPTALLLPSTTLHVVAISIWVGGLAMLLFVLPGAMGALDLANRTRLLAGVLARFSTIAGACVAVVLVTGVAQSLVYVRSLDNALHTDYGRIALAKIVVFVGLLGLGGYNRRVSVPRLNELATVGGSPGRAGVLLRRALRGEVLLVVVVLGITGALAGFAPSTAAQTASGPFATTQMIGPAQLQVTVDPARVGSNLMHLYLLDPVTGAQWDRAKDVRVVLVHRDKEIELDATTRKGGPGHYVVDAAVLGASGTWSVEIAARVSEFDEYSTTIDVPIGSP